MIAKRVREQLSNKKIATSAGLTESVVKAHMRGDVTYSNASSIETKRKIDAYTKDVIQEALNEMKQ